MLLKSDEEVRISEDLRAETLKDEDIKNLDELLGEDKSRAEEMKTSKDDMVTGMEDAKRKALEDLDEEEEKNNDKDKDKSSDAIKENNEDKRNKKKSSKVNALDMRGDDVQNDIDSEDFIRILGTIAYIDFSEF